MKRIMFRWGAGLVCTVALLAGPLKTKADFLYLIDNTWEGTGPTAAAPWISELFQDLGGGKVSLTISNIGLSGSEYVQELYLNLNPTLDPANLTLTAGTNTSGLTLPSVSTGANSFKADGGGKYDIMLSFSTANNGRFAANDFITFTITDSAFSTLSTSDFSGYYATSSGGHGPFLAGAHIVSIGVNGDSGWDNPTQVTPFFVPEPAAGLLLVLGAGVWAGARRFKVRL